MSKIPGGRRIPAAGSSHPKTPASSSQIPSRAGPSGISTKGESTGKLQTPGSKLTKPKESKLKKFDRTVNEELRRRKDTGNVLVGATTSDVNVQEAVAHLAKAETANLFAGAVQAAELAAANVDPERAEEAAAEGAKTFQAELVDVIDEDIAGARPIQVIGYIGITRPKRATR